MVDFEKAIKLLNKTLNRKQPRHFSSSWIFKHAPRAYHFFRLNFRTTTGSIDWDTVTRELERPFQKRWTRNRRKRRELPKLYKSRLEVDAVFKKYHNKQYTFISCSDADDRVMRDRISIALVRIAQKGNITAQQELSDLLKFTVENWIERYWYFSRWRYYPDSLEEQIEACMRRYRFTGSFVSYLFVCLIYSARALAPIKIFSLDKPIFDGEETTWGEHVVQDPITGEARMYERGQFNDHT